MSKQKKLTIMDQVHQARQEVAEMYESYELAVQEGDGFRDTAMNAYDSLEQALRCNYSDEVFAVYHRRVQSYSALATMCYARAAAIKP